MCPRTSFFRAITVFALIASVSILLSSCGAPTPHAERLNGNWQLTGDPVASTEPAISVMLYGSGGQITGTAVAILQCANEPTTRRMMNLQLNGQENLDGTYTVASATDGYGDVLNLNGPMPHSGQQSWSGSYSLYAPLSDPTTALTCLLKPTASFQAVAITPLSGTYSGSITGNNLSPDATMAIQITQAATLTGMAGYGATASLSVTGSSLFQGGVAGIGRRGCDQRRLDYAALQDGRRFSGRFLWSYQCWCKQDRRHSGRRWWQVSLRCRLRHVATPIAADSKAIDWETEFVV